MRTPFLVVVAIAAVGCRQIEVVRVDDRTIAAKNENVRDWVRAYDEAEVPAVAFFDDLPVESYRIVEGELRGANSGGIERTVFSFVHISDVQIRDERVQLFGAFGTQILDKIVSTTRFDDDQEKYDASVYLSLVKGLNQYDFEQYSAVGDELVPTTENPVFVIHTGDAIHTGVLQEVWEFLFITNELSLPWYQVVGNHDVIVFGTDLGRLDVTNPTFASLPTGDVESFVKFHYPIGSKEFPTFKPGIQIIPPLGKRKSKPASQSPAEKIWPKGESKAHGFDVRLSPDPPLKGEIGYYSFAFGGPARTGPSPDEEADDEAEAAFAEADVEALAARATIESTWSQDRVEPGGATIRGIVLNTAEEVALSEGGFDGDEQIEWLENELRLARKFGQLVIVFGHHPFGDPKSFPKDREDRKRVVRLLAEQPGLLGYFCGHAHSFAYRAVRSDRGDAFWEIQAPSILEWPQAGLLVRVRVDPGAEKFWLEVDPFTSPYRRREGDERLDPCSLDPTIRLKSEAILGRRGARRDKTGFFGGKPKLGLTRLRLLVPNGRPR